MTGTTVRFHKCRSCDCCGGCFCDDHHWRNGLCRGCRDYVTLTENLERYLAAAREGGWFIQRQHYGKIHAVGCPVFNGHVRRATEIVDGGCDHGRDAGCIAFPSRLVRADVLEPGERCMVCAPNVILPPKPEPPMRIWWKTSGTGWPAEPRRSLTEVLGPRRTRPPS